MKTIHIRNLKVGEMPLIAGVLTDSDVVNVEKSLPMPVDLIELRVDMFDNISTAHIINIFQKTLNKFGKPVIATIRDIKEGGQKKINNRISIYREIIPLSDAVDVEIGSAENKKNIFAEIKKLSVDFKKILIGSYHNFESTPDDTILESIISKGTELGADIIKIAAMAKNRDDMVRLLMFTLKHKDKGVITMSMGDAGLPSRIISPIFGSLITYGYINRSSAPGQMSAAELMDIFKRLKIRQV